MPFKRAGWLQQLPVILIEPFAKFQCPLSGLVGCNKFWSVRRFPPSVSMPFKRAGWLQRWGVEVAWGQGFWRRFSRTSEEWLVQTSGDGERGLGKCLRTKDFAACANLRGGLASGEVRAALTRLFDSHGTAGCGCKPLSVLLVKRICGKWCRRGHVTGSLRAESTCDRLSRGRLSFGNQPSFDVL